MMIAELEDRNFDQFVQAATAPVLIEFWQPACSHCHALLHELELVQTELGNRMLIRKMNVQENHLIPADLEIQSLPALALFVNGEFQTFIGGIGKKKELLQQLEPWLLIHDPKTITVDSPLNKLHRGSRRETPNHALLPHEGES